MDRESARWERPGQQVTGRGSEPGSEPGRAQSALELRLVLASIGLVSCGAGAGAAAVAGWLIAAAVLSALAALALVDLVVVERRRQEHRLGR